MESHNLEISNKSYILLTTSVVYLEARKSGWSPGELNA